MNPEHQSLRFYLFGAEAQERILAACASAQQSIDIEHFIFHDDTIGQRLVSVLRERARAGVRVRVLCDAVGSWNLYTSRYPTDMRDDNIDVRFVNIISPWRINNFLSWFFRDHRKIVIIDRKIGFTGGIGFRDDMAHWRDTTIEVGNHTVDEMLTAFNEMWDRSIEQKLSSRIQKTKTYSRGFQFLTSSPYFRKRFLYYAIIDAIRNAERTVYITTPYFVPDRRLARVLRLAASRGVDVRLLLPSDEPEPFVGWATRSHYEKMLRAGVRIFEYKKAFLHSKTIIVDDAWATIGSFNLDRLSILYNYEANIVSTDPDMVHALKKHFADDLTNTEEIVYRTWLTRPAIQKIRELVILPIRRFL
jgi:cardiolipin synthase